MRDGVRTLVLGLDGATFRILDALADAGVMPFMGELRTRGMSATLMSTVNPLTPPAWTTIMTGRSPGNHGIYDFVRSEERGGAAFFALNTSRDRRVETIWDIASRQQRRVTTLNFVGMSPPRPIAGHSISGFVPHRHLKRAMWPPTLFDALQQLPDFNRRELAMDLDLEKKSIQGLPESDYESWIALHRRREKQWFEIARWLMTHEPSDLTALVFDGVDKVQHVFWRYLDPDIYREETATPDDRRVRAMCLEYYREVDGYMRALVELAGRDTRLFVVSDHGFGPTWEVFYLNVWLAERGYLTWRDAPDLDETGALTANRVKSHIGMLDWERTKAFCLTPSSNGVTIRRAEAGGFGVRPEEYEPFRRRIADELLQWRDPEGGEPVVTSVIPREEAYPGSMMEKAPDLLLTLRDHGFVSLLNADRPVRRRERILGTHRPEGVFLAIGPGIEPGRSETALDIVDVAPTVLYSLGLPVPSDLEGKVPARVFSPVFLRQRPVEKGAPTHPPDPFADVSEASQPPLGEEAEAEMVARLRALGYVE
jgi:predicted AlkP superfamily phosphohydrolase/phosphomutase